MGQVYIPQVNWALMVSTIVIVIGFGSSSARRRLRHCGHADDGDYGDAAAVRRHRALGLAAGARLCRHRLFLTIDLAFFGANALKIAHGGWLPLVIGGFLFTLMTTWKTGRRLVAARLTARAVPIEEFLATVRARGPRGSPGTAVFMTAQPRGTPPALAHNLRYNKVLHEHVVTLMVTTRRSARAARQQIDGALARPRRVRCQCSLWLHGGSQCPGGAGAGGERGWSSTKATSPISSAAKRSSSPR